MSAIKRKPKRGEVWIGGGYRVLVTSGPRATRVSFTRLNSEAKGTPVRCEMAQFLAAYKPEVPDAASKP
jgi:hypothetical protein